MGLGGWGWLRRAGGLLASYRTSCDPSQVVGITDQADVISGLDGCHTLLRRNANGDDGAPEVMLADKAIATSFV